MDQQAIAQKFTAALDGLVEQVKKDRTVLAALLCGSLSHDHSFPTRRSSDLDRKSVV